MLSQFQTQQLIARRILQLTALKASIYKSLIDISVAQPSHVKLIHLLKVGGELAKATLELRIAQGHLSAQEPMVMQDLQNLVIFNSLAEDQLLKSYDHYNFLSNVIYRLNDNETTYVLTLCEANKIREVIPPPSAPAQYFVPSQHPMLMPQMPAQMFVANGFVPQVPLHSLPKVIQTKPAALEVPATIVTEVPSVVKNPVAQNESTVTAIATDASPVADAISVVNSVPEENKDQSGKASELLADPSTSIATDASAVANAPVATTQNAVEDVLEESNGQNGHTKTEESEEERVTQKLSQLKIKESKPKIIDLKGLIHNANSEKGFDELYSFLEKHPEQRQALVEHIQELLLAKKVTPATEKFVQNVTLTLEELKSLILKKANSLKSIIQSRASKMENETAKTKLVSEGSIEAKVRPIEPVVSSAVIANVSLKSRVQSALDSRNALEFNKLLQDYPKRKRDIYDCLAVNIGKLPISFITELALNPDVIYSLVAETKQIPTNVKQTLLLMFCDKLATPGFIADYEKYQQFIVQHNKVPVNADASSDAELRRVVAAFKFLDNTYETWLRGKADEEFLFLENLQPGAGVGNNALRYSINKTNSKGESILLVALRKKLTASVISSILEKTSSATLLLSTLETQENALHYWARYLTRTSLTTLDPIFKTVIKALASDRKNLAKVLVSSKMVDRFGNTFLHTLFSENNDPKLLGMALVSLASQPYSQDMLPCGLVANNADHTIYSLVDIKAVPMPELQKSICLTFIPIAFKFAMQMSKEDTAIFFSARHNFFTNHGLKHFLDKYDLKSLLKTIQLRYSTQTDVASIYTRAIEDKFPEITAMRKGKLVPVVTYFNATELTNSYSQALMIENDAASQETDPLKISLLEMLVDMVLSVRYPEAKTFFSLLDAQVSENPEITMNLPKIQNDCVELERILTEEFPFSEVSNDMPIAKLISWKTIIFYLVMGKLYELPERHKNRLIAHEYRHLDSSSNARALEVAAELQFLPLVKYLHEECLSPINAKIVYAAFSGKYLDFHSNTINPNYNDEIIDYLLAKYIENFTTRRCPIIFDEQPLLQDLLFILFTGNFSDPASFNLNLALFNRLLDRKDGKNDQVVTQLLKQKDGSGYCAISILFSFIFNTQDQRIVPKTYVLMKLFLESGAPILDIGKAVNGSVLFYCLASKHPTILDLFLEHIPLEQLEDLLAIRNADGITVLELSQKRTLETKSITGETLSDLDRDMRAAMYNKLIEAQAKCSSRVKNLI